MEKNKVKHIRLGILFLFLGMFAALWGQPDNFSNPDSLLHKVEQENEYFYQLLSSKTAPTIGKEIEKNPLQHVPPVIFAWAQHLFSTGQKDEAVFWFTVAQFRTLVDLKIHEGFLDHHKRKVAGLYVEHFGQEIANYILSDPYKRKTLIRQAIDFATHQVQTYPSWWIYLDGAEKEADLEDLLKLEVTEEDQSDVRKHIREGFGYRLDKWLADLP